MAPSHYLNQYFNIVSWTHGPNFSESFVRIQTFWSKKMHLKMSSVKWHALCLSLNALTHYGLLYHWFGWWLHPQLLAVWSQAITWIKADINQLTWSSTPRHLKFLTWKIEKLGISNKRHPCVTPAKMDRGNNTPTKGSTDKIQGLISI